MADRLKETLDREWQASDEAEESTDPSELPYDERVAYWRERVPRPYTHGYEALLAKNCPPRIAAAVCQYVAGLDGEVTAESQAEVAAEYDISEESIRNWHPELTDTRDRR